MNFRIPTEITTGCFLGILLIKSRQALFKSPRDAPEILVREPEQTPYVFLHRLPQELRKLPSKIFTASGKFLEMNSL